MRWLHLSLGILSLIAFVVTGLYMHVVHDHLASTELARRTFWRSRHIYILLIAITLLTLAAYARPTRKRQWLQYAGSAIFGLSAAAITVAFFVEVDQPTLRSPLSAVAIQALVPATLMHLYAGWRGFDVKPSG